jgi:hypothetical protein
MQYMALNSYRSSTDTGFANTWTTFRVTPADRKNALIVGIPTHDSDTPTTIGIRSATRAEIQQYREKREWDRGYGRILHRDNNGNWNV